jgi:ATP-dependent DNA ligase
VPTVLAANLDELKANYKHFLAAKYEGVMMRAVSGKYQPGWKSWHCQELLKVKPVHDAEFTIVGWSMAEKGKAAGALMIECEIAPGGKRFTVTPALPIQQRIEMAQAMPKDFAEKWRGRPLRVYFDELSATGVPVRARTEMMLRETMD